MQKKKIKKLDIEALDIDIKEKSTSFLKEFKKFALKDSTLSVAIGLMLGGAVKSVIDSLVKDILTPPIGKLTSGLDFSNLYVALTGEKFESLKAAQDAGAVVITYGNFINATISFLITALTLFLIVSIGQRFVKKEEKREGRKTRKCPFCRSEISKKATRCPFCTSHLDKKN